MFGIGAGVGSVLAGGGGHRLHFRAHASDTRAATLSYTRDWGDGTSASTGTEASHAFADDGAYRVTLTVVDADGAVPRARCVTSRRAR